jgi:hypothetical protein
MNGPYRSKWTDKVVPLFEQFYSTALYHSLQLLKFPHVDVAQLGTNDPHEASWVPEQAFWVGLLQMTMKCPEQCKFLTVLQCVEFHLFREDIMARWWIGNDDQPMEKQLQFIELWCKFFLFARRTSQVSDLLHVIACSDRAVNILLIKIRQQYEQNVFRTQSHATTPASSILLFSLFNEYLSYDQYDTMDPSQRPDWMVNLDENNNLLKQQFEQDWLVKDKKAFLQQELLETVLVDSLLGNKLFKNALELKHSEYKYYYTHLIIVAYKLITGFVRHCQYQSTWMECQLLDAAKVRLWVNAMVTLDQSIVQQHKLNGQLTFDYDSLVLWEGEMMKSILSNHKYIDLLFDCKLVEWELEKENITMLAI